MWTMNPWLLLVGLIFCVTLPGPALLRVSTVLAYLIAVAAYIWRHPLPPIW
jgi:uncharacterized membrane protein YccC